MKKLTVTLVASMLFLSCSSRAIEPVPTVAPPKPKQPLRVWWVTPSWGRVEYPEKISISGTGFEVGAKVFLGEHECLRPRVQSNYLIRCRVPDLPDGDDYLISVVNPDGTKAPNIAESDGVLYDQVKGGNIVYFYAVKKIRK